MYNRTYLGSFILPTVMGDIFERTIYSLHNTSRSIPLSLTKPLSPPIPHPNSPFPYHCTFLTGNTLSSRPPVPPEYITSLQTQPQAATIFSPCFGFCLRSCLGSTIMAEWPVLFILGGMRRTTEFERHSKSRALVSVERGESLRNWQLSRYCFAEMLLVM